MAKIITISAVLVSLTMLMLMLLPLSSRAAPIGMTGCDTTCGDVNVPYPFGMGPSRCYHAPGFNLTCDRTSNPPRLLPGDNMSLRVVNISLRGNTVRLLQTGAITFATRAYQGRVFFLSAYFPGDTEDASYSLSIRNELIVAGCNAKATVYNGNNTIGGCASFCSDNRNIIVRVESQDKYCHGTVCCQARISMPTGGMPNILVFDTNNVHDLNVMPAFVLIAEEGWFDKRNFFGEMGRNVQREEVPMVIQWEVLEPAAAPGDIKSQHPNCPMPSSGTVCKSKHSYCIPGNRGYSCQCSDGYHGNPYLLDGCQGGPKYFKGISAVIGVASGAGLVLLVLIALFISNKIKQRRTQLLKRKLFEQNRGQLLRQLVSHRADIAERMIISLEELEKVTNNFSKARELGGGDHGTVYKGILSNLHVVAIKKPKKVIQKEIDEFINEVVILSQINHRNIVKLYGCCLEIEVPLLVYEFISNGTLYNHLHIEGPRSLSWGDRLQIATETAKSLAYLHSTASVPIIHRDIKSVNILLDDALTTKVADFGALRYISVEKSGLTTKVQGTIGYLDPMYFYTGRLTKKSDIYSFGVMLVELLTRKKPFSYLSPEGNRLVACFSTLYAQGNLSHIVDPQVMDEESKGVQEAGALAVTCIKLKGDDRPTMRQVELTLENLRSLKKHVMENGVAVNFPSTLDGRGNEESSRQYSMEEEFVLSASYPR